jgi:integrase
VDLIERVIHFPDSSLSLSERRKGRGTVPINDDLFYVLNHAAKSWSSKGDQHVIQSNGHAVTAIYDAWNKLMSASGLNGVTPHVLRHTVATNLVRSNADIYQVSKLLGHASVRTTESIYVHHDAEVLRPMMNLLTAGGKA